MGATAAVHPTDQTLQSYGLGKLDDASSVSVSKHLEGCDSCHPMVWASWMMSLPSRSAYTWKRAILASGESPSSRPTISWDDCGKPKSSRTNRPRVGLHPLLRPQKELRALLFHLLRPTPCRPT
jgi:hypothetical protein